MVFLDTYETHCVPRESVLILGDDDIKAIADEVLRRLTPLLSQHQDYNRPHVHFRDFTEEIRIINENYQKKRDEEDRLVSEIIEKSQNIPKEYRPTFEQYKSLSRKKVILELLKDPSRWPEIPMLSKQWPGTPRKNTAKKNDDK